MSAMPPSPIGPEQEALIARHVSAIVGSRDAALRPHLVRAVAWRLSDDRRRLMMLLPQAGSRAVLDDLRANGRIAVVFSEPSSDHTLQVKGNDAQVSDAGHDASALVARHLEGFIEEIGRLGFPADVARTLLGHADDLMAVHFTIAEAFEQTPGPRAGERLPPPC